MQIIAYKLFYDKQYTRSYEYNHNLSPKMLFRAYVRNLNLIYIYICLHNSIL